MGGLRDMAERPHVTDLLDAVARGEEKARNELFERVYQELKRIARSQLRRSGDWMSVNPTTLLHEAWLKFSRTDGREMQGSAHFYNILSQAMRHVLTDIARSRVTTKRGHQMVRIELHEQIEQPETSLSELLAVDAALEKLQTCDSDLAQLVEWHFFGGISFVEIAKIRGVTERTVRRHWDMARLFLANAIESAPNL
jgi:RNA polymerase sigma factor (TIGR02999 family)